MDATELVFELLCFNLGEFLVNPVAVWHDFSGIDSDLDLEIPPFTGWEVVEHGGVHYVVYLLSWTYTEDLPLDLGLTLSLRYPDSSETRLLLGPETFSSTYISRRIAEL